MNILSLNDLSIYIRGTAGSGSDINIVNRLSLDVPEKTIFGLAGESGCGKSITAYSIIGLLSQNAYCTGKIVFDGADLSLLTDEEMRRLRGNRISMVFQEPMTSLNPVLTIGNQIAEVLTTHKGMGRKDALDTAVRLLSDVRIPMPQRRIKDYPHQLSGGMRQRVMIAIAIACSPALIIADEPTTALDVTIQAQILYLLREISERYHTSIILITHDLGIIAENAAIANIMYAGRIMESASSDALFKNPLHPYTQGLLGSLPGSKTAVLRPIPGSVPHPKDLPAGCKFSNRCAIATGRCKTEEPMLTEAAPGHLVRCIMVGTA